MKTVPDDEPAIDLNADLGDCPADDEPAIDLNVDLGEGAPDDDALLDIVTSCNIACGGHAGDPRSMRRTLIAARERGVAAGAHPSYPDREGFGRQSGFLPATEVAGPVVRQLAALCAIAEQEGVVLTHVKPHGALYNDAAEDAELADALCEALAAVAPDLALTGPPASRLEASARQHGMRYWREGFVDRAYTARGTLVPRSEAGAVYSDPGRAAAQALLLAREGKAVAASGETVAVPAQTLCVHGDSPGAVGMARAVRTALSEAGVRLRAPGRSGS